MLLSALGGNADLFRIASPVSDYSDLIPNVLTVSFGNRVYIPELNDFSHWASNCHKLSSLPSSINSYSGSLDGTIYKVGIISETSVI